MILVRINIKTDFGTDSEEFKHYVGRYPTRKELIEYARLQRKALDSQLDWDVIAFVASESFIK